MALQRFYKELPAAHQDLFVSYCMEFSKEYKERKSKLEKDIKAISEEIDKKYDTQKSTKQQVDVIEVLLSEVSDTEKNLEVLLFRSLLRDQLKFLRNELWAQRPTELLERKNKLKQELTKVEDILRIMSVLFIGLEFFEKSSRGK